METWWDAAERVVADVEQTISGEASIADNAQPMTASMLCLLPRILPAPQALLKPTRPTRLPTYKAQMIGVHSGVTVDSVGFFANIIHPLDEQRPHSFRVLEIRHKDEPGDDGQTVVKRKGTSWSAMLLPHSTSNASVAQTKRIPRPPSDTGTPEPKDANDGRRAVAFEDVEKGADDIRGPPEPVPGVIRRRRTVREQMTDFVANPMPKPERPAVPPALGSPIHVVTVISFLVTLLIFVLTAYWRDGNALIATCIISVQASLVGYASWWKPQLMVRPSPHGRNDVPPGDMMIRTREGAFILVRCREEVARELYTGTEECQYHVGATLYRFCMALGTVLLMIGVVLLGNTRFNAQALIAGSYIVLNGVYWLLGMLPKRLFWDLSRYDWEDVTPEDAQNADVSTFRRSPRNEEDIASFTRTLWYAIRETGSTGWVGRSGAAPSTAQWRQWLKEAGENAEAGNREWTAVARKDEIMRGPPPPGEPKTDRAEQHAPVTVPAGDTSVAPVTGSL